MDSDKLVSVGRDFEGFKVEPRSQLFADVNYEIMYNQTLAYKIHSEFGT